MYTLKQAVHSHGHGKTFPLGAEVTARDFPQRTLDRMVAEGVAQETGGAVAPAPVAEAAPMAKPEVEAELPEVAEDEDEPEAPFVEEAVGDEPAAAPADEESQPEPKRGKGAR